MIDRCLYLKPSEKAGLVYGSPDIRQSRDVNMKKLLAGT